MEKAEKPWNKKSGSLTFVEAFYEYSRHWKKYILAISFCLIAGLAVVFTSQRVYKTSLSILLNEDEIPQPQSSEIDWEALGLSPTTNNIDNEIIILQSPDLMQKVVDNLNLRTSYYTRNKLRQNEIYSGSPFFVKDSTPGKGFEGIIDVSIEKNESNFHIKGSYEISGNKKDIDETVNSLPVRLLFEDGELELSIRLTGKDIIESEKYYVVINNTSSTVDYLTSRLSVIPTSKNSSVLNIGIIGNNPERGAAILKELVKQYNNQNNNIKDEIAHNMGIFINERLREISGELGDVEDNVVDYKQKNRITDLSTEAQMFVEQTGQNEDHLVEVETQLNIISMVESFVSDPANRFKLIPNLGISDTGLSQIITEYNNKLLNSDVLLKNMSVENPTRIRLEEEINNIRGSIYNSLKNVKQSYNVSRQDLRKRSNSTLSRVQTIPEQEKGLIGIMREQSIKENLVTFLMQKKEETNLSLASTADKARIIASPQNNLPPIAPKSNMTLLSALLIGILAPTIAIYMINQFNTKISNRGELEKLSSVSIIGEIAKNTDNSPIAILPAMNTGIGEMFRAMRNNLNFMFNHKNNQIILVTSTASGEGKTFVSVNLALTFALSGAKVLLVGADIRSPQFKEYFEQSTKEGLTDFLIEKSDNWQDYVNRTDLDKNMDVIFSGTTPPNPNELMMSSRMEQFLSQAKEKYDIVILDTAPVGLVSDTFLISEFADACIYIVRENMTSKDSVNFINVQKEENKLKNMHLLLNASSLSKGQKYGYGKTYGQY